MPMDAAAPRRLGNLPTDATSFVDRGEELSGVRGLLASRRLVTLTGPGGVGKTRLAIRAAEGFDRRLFPDGLWFVDFAPLHGHALLAETIVQVLGIGNNSSRNAVDALLAYLRNKRMLLLLDNCDRVVAECSDLVSTLLQGAPELHLLVTSRRALRTSQEHLFGVEPLDAPTPHRAGADGGRRQHAAELFAQRARAVAPDFTVTDENHETIARLCQQLDGMPLAIELAAARLQVLSLDELANKLSGESLPAMPHRRPQGRHGTMNATLRWSYELCSEAERLMWARMSVFSGGFDLAEAESVCADTRIETGSVADLVAGLVDESILIRHDRSGHDRYWLLDAVRGFGLELLRDRGEYDEMRCKHRDYYLWLAEQGEHEWFGPHQVGWFDRLRPEHSNLRTALDHCLAAGEIRTGMRMASALWFYWIACGYVSEGRYWLERVLSLDTMPSAERATALWVDGYLAVFQGDNQGAVGALEESRGIADELGDPSASAYVTQMLGLAALARGEMREADALLTHALEQHESADRFDGIVTIGRVMIAYAAVGEGEYDRAIELSKRVQHDSERHGDLWARSWALWTLALVEWSRGQPEETDRYARSCLRIKQIFHDVLGMAFALEVLAWTAGVTGRLERAAVLLGSAHGTWLTMGQPMADAPQLLHSHDLSVSHVRATLGEQAFQEAFDHGRYLDVHEAADYGLEVPVDHDGMAPRHDRQHSK